VPANRRTSMSANRKKGSGVTAAQSQRGRGLPSSWLGTPCLLENPRPGFARRAALPPGACTNLRRHCDSVASLPPWNPSWNPFRRSPRSLSALSALRVPSVLVERPGVPTCELVMRRSWVRFPQAAPLPQSPRSELDLGLLHVRRGAVWHDPVRRSFSLRAQAEATPCSAGEYPEQRLTPITLNELEDAIQVASHCHADGGGRKTTEEILTEYPYLEPEDIRQVLAYSATVAETSSSDRPHDVLG